MERLYNGFDMITKRVHTSNQQRQIYLGSLLRAFDCLSLLKHTRKFMVS